MNVSNRAQISRHEVIVLILSVFVLMALLVRTVIPLSSDNNQLLDRIDLFICLFFFYDFCLRFYQAPSKWRFLRWGWIDLLSSIPIFNWFLLGRLVGVIRILRMIRAFRSTRSFLAYLFRDRAQGTLAVVLLSAVLLLVFAAIAILNVETGPESNIKTPGDALWWSLVTITTVGYGDRYPVTTVGRLIAAVLMVAGVGLFGTFSGFIAKFFVEDEQQQEESEIQTLIEEVRRLRDKIDALEKRQ